MTLTGLARQHRSRVTAPVSTIHTNAAPFTALTKYKKPSCISLALMMPNHHSSSLDITLMAMTSTPSRKRCRLLMLPPELALVILCQLDLVTLYRIRQLHPKWTPLVMEALIQHLHRTSVLLTFEQEERWRLRVEIPFLHFDPHTLLCTFVPQRDPRTARRYYRSLFLRQPVLRTIRRQTRWDRGQIHRPGLHRIARQDAACRDWECIYHVTRDRPVASTTITTTTTTNNHNHEHAAIPSAMEPLLPHQLLPSTIPLTANTSTAPVAAAFTQNTANTVDENRRSGERWLCPATFQCHLGFLVGMGASSPSSLTSNSLARNHTRKVRDPDADLVRCVPGKPLPSLSAGSWFARWFSRVVAPHHHHHHYHQIISTRSASRRRPRRQSNSAFPLHVPAHLANMDALSHTHQSLPLLRYTSEPLPLTTTNTVNNLSNDATRVLSGIHANNRSLLSNLTTFVNLRRHRLVHPQSSTTLATANIPNETTNGAIPFSSARDINTPIFHIYEH
ncbi:hypothetical protein BDF22DRAFT_745063 [Syncephalis plumigaleata]|nr:hypothetical protein BDF22DRAFT_745063 [Syncephalis plumigaleata]